MAKRGPGNPYHDPKSGEFTSGPSSGLRVVRGGRTELKKDTLNPGNAAGRQIMENFHANKRAEETGTINMFKSVADILNAPDTRSSEQKLKERNDRIERHVQSRLKEQQELINRALALKNEQRGVGPLENPILEKYSKGLISRNEALRALAEDPKVKAQSNASVKRQRRETDIWAKTGAWMPEDIANHEIHKVDARSGNIDYSTGQRFKNRGHELSTLRSAMNVAGKTEADFRRQALYEEGASKGGGWSKQTGYKGRTKFTPSDLWHIQLGIFKKKEND